MRQQFAVHIDIKLKVRCGLQAKLLQSAFEIFIMFKIPMEFMDCLVVDWRLRGMYNLHYIVWILLNICSQLFCA